MAISSANAENSRTLASMYANFTREFPEVRGIKAKELHDLLQSPAKDDIVLVDARTAGEQDVSKLPGNVLTKEEFEKQKDSLKDKQLICYCTAGYRSGKYADILRKEGFNVRNLEGSILAWTHEGYPLVDKSNNPTKKVHVFGEKWRIQGEGYEAETYNPVQGSVEVAKTILPKWLGGSK